jgi:parallel beta-helix repeat protein
VSNNYGIYLQDSSNITVRGNLDVNDWVGICLQNSGNVVVEDNVVVDAEKALSLYEASGNRIEGNTLNSSVYGIRLFNSNLNMIFHNNLINNDEQADVINSYENVWDTGLEGNFWSDHVKVDANKDGIEDSPCAVEGSDGDRYPLMGTFHSFRISSEDDSCVTVVTNSSLLSFVFENQSGTIRLIVDGSDDTYGFCRMSIPKSVVEPSVEVIIDGGLTQVLDANYSLHSDSSNTWIFFAFHLSSHEIIIVPEYWPLILSLALVSAIAWYPLLRKMRKDGERISPVEY